MQTANDNLEDVVSLSLVEIRDHQIWAKHIHGNEPLKAKILTLVAGELIELEVNGFRGVWKKMEDNGKTGEPTDGIKPFGKARDAWHILAQSRRGDLIPIQEA